MAYATRTAGPINIVLFCNQIPAANPRGHLALGGFANCFGASGHWSPVPPGITFSASFQHCRNTVYLTQGLHRALQRHPDKIALTHLTESGERHLTHAQRMDAIARQAAALSQRGVRSGDRVALLAPNTDQLIVAIL